MLGFLTKIAKGPPGTLGDLSVLGVQSQPKMSNHDCWGPGEYVDTHIVGVSNKMAKGPPGTLGDLSVLGVQSQLKMSNLGCWGPGESVDTHIVGFCNKIFGEYLSATIFVILFAFI